MECKTFTISALKHQNNSISMDLELKYLQKFPRKIFRGKNAEKPAKYEITFYRHFQCDVKLTRSNQLQFPISFV